MPSNLRRQSTPVKFLPALPAHRGAPAACVRASMTRIVSVPEMDTRTVRFEGFERIHLVADVCGDGRDWPVLLMHGGGQTRHAWGKTAQVIAGHGWRAVSLDLRGH